MLKNFRTFFLGSNVIILFSCLFVLPCIASGIVYDQFFLSHRRAYRKWLQREPDHYQYKFTVNKLMVTHQWQVEVKNSQIVHITGTTFQDVGQGTTWTNAVTLYPLQISPNENMIEEIFDQIEKGYSLPRSPSELLARSNPEFYQNHLEDFWLPGGWDHCNPAFPKVNYHPTYYFPEKTTLSGKPCVNSIDLGSSMTIQIDFFEPISD